MNNLKTSQPAPSLLSAYPLAQKPSTTACDPTAAAIHRRTRIPTAMPKDERHERREAQNSQCSKDQNT